MKERLEGRPGRSAPGNGTRPTIKAVAAAAGVSTATVSQAVNDTGRISEATRRRVLAAAAELGWSPSAPATALRRARTRTIALVVRRPTDVLGADPHFSELITGLEGQLAPRGYGLLLHLVPDMAEESALYERLAAEGRIDGAVPDRRPRPTTRAPDSSKASACPPSCSAHRTPPHPCPGSASDSRTRASGKPSPTC